MSYVPVNTRGGAPRRGLVPSLAGLGDASGIPPYVIAIIQQIEAQYPLNTDAVQALVNAIQNRLTAELKKQAVEKASVAAGMSAVAIVCAYIPILGWAADAIIAVIQVGLQITNGYYKNEAAKLQNATLNYLRTLAAEYEAKLLAYQGQIVEQEAPNAYQLAVSGATLHGLGAWQANLARDMRRAVTATAIAAKPIEHLTHVMIQGSTATLMRVPVPVVQSVARSVSNAENNSYAYLQSAQKKVDDFIQVGTGEAELKKTQEACDRVRKVAEAEFERQYQIALANSNLPQFREALRNGLAAIFRTDPSINSILSQVVAAAASGQSANMTFAPQQPSKALQAVPMVATGIAAAAALLFFKR